MEYSFLFIRMGALEKNPRQRKDSGFEVNWDQFFNKKIRLFAKKSL